MFCGQLSLKEMNCATAIRKTGEMLMIYKIYGSSLNGSAHWHIFGGCCMCTRRVPE